VRGVTVMRPIVVETGREGTAAKLPARGQSGRDDTRIDNNTSEMECQRVHFHHYMV
jgi:hypothetical protein